MASPKKTDLRDIIDGLSGLFRIVPIEVPDCPVFLAVAMPLGESVTGHMPRLPAGRGLTPWQAAISAAAEAIELLASLAQNIGPGRFGLHSADGLLHMPATDLVTGKQVMVLAQRVFLDAAAVFGEPLVEVADSNGCAAGATFADATSRAILEYIERDACAIWWYGRQSREHLPVAILDAAVPRLSWWLGERQRRTILIDVSSDLGVPVVVAASAEPDGSHVALGSAAAPRLAGAALAAVTEMIQTEVSMEMGNVPENAELRQWLGVGSVDTMPQFRRIGMTDTTAVSANADPLARLSRAGFSVLAIDLTRSGDLLSSARVIIPGLCAMRRKIEPERILRHNLANARLNGVLSADQFETVEPY